MNSFSISDLVSYTELLLAGYLLILGLISLIRWNANRNELFFHAASICCSVVLLSDHLDHILLTETAALLIWAFFYLFVSRSLQPGSHGIGRYSSFLLPIIWLLISFLLPEQPYVHFQTIYFFQFILIGLSSAHKTYKIKNHQLSASESNINYFKWLHVGLLTLIVVRLSLPLLAVSIDVYISIFHLTLSVFLIGISGFQRGALKTNITLLVEETTNLEEMTKRKLEAVLKKDKVFLIPDLTINELAVKMQMKASDLSIFFNSKLGMNFNDVVNQHRIDEVKRLIMDPTTDPKATIMELAYKSGFNSKATFNRIFKQLTGNTPKEYRNRYA